jgi:hypothetical protein
LKYSNRKQKHLRSIGYRSQGFSLFELIVFIIVSGILYAGAARRVTDFPGDAERANFYAITTQIGAGINLEMMMGITRGLKDQLAAFANANPMDLLLQAPSNYIGAFDALDINGIGRRVWYFDRFRGELVYLANDAEGLTKLINGTYIPTSELRFILSVEYSYRDASGLPVELTGGEASGNAGSRRSISGLILKPVIPFEWSAGDIQANLAEFTEN